MCGGGGGGGGGEGVVMHCTIMEAQQNGRSRGAAVRWSVRVRAKCWPPYVETRIQCAKNAREQGTWAQALGGGGGGGGDLGAVSATAGGCSGSSDWGGPKAE